MKSMLARAAYLAAAITWCALPLVAGQAPAGGPAPPAQAPAAPQGRGGGAGNGGFGGAGNTKVLLITKGHPFDREPFFQLFDQPPVGATARWTHVEQPAAEIFFDPALAKDYDVFVFYDMNGSQGDRRKPSVGQGGQPMPNKDGSASFTWRRRPLISSRMPRPCCARASDDLPAPRISIVAHSWPEFSEVMGIACDWGQPLRVRGIDHPKSAISRTPAAHHRCRQGASDYAGPWRRLRNRG